MGSLVLGYRMIHVPTAPWAHGVFDAMAWASGAGFGVAVSRWRLRVATADLAAASTN
jgi:phosphatidylglycerol---prolipoprotein diacylglyceryl transferase